MAIPPRKIRQLPPAGPAQDSDVFPVSQMNEAGVATTRAMTRSQFQNDIIQVINEARQEFVNTANAEHRHLQEQLDSLQSAVDQNEINDANMQAALIMVQQMVNGESGKTPYDLWLEAGNSGSMADYLNSLVGPQGPRGETGLQGPQGVAGAIGPAGPVGPQGPSGATGERGPAGERGAIGPAGPKGDAGAKGDTGSQGPKGDAGSQGAVGATGPAGPQGVKGDTGAQGAKGDTGATGPAGAAGAKGDPGAVILGEVDVVDSAVVALSLGVRTKDVTIPASWGLRTTDTLFVTAATALPAGYAIDNAIPLTTTSIRFYFVGPALALLASNTLRVRVAAIARVP